MLSARGKTAFALGVVAALVGGCGGGGDSTPNPSPLVVAKEPTASGDAQTGPVSEALPNNLRIVVTRDGSPQSGVTVNWSTATGSLAPTSGPTGGDGIAASSWTLGPTAGAQTAQAVVAGATGSPVTFSATATAGPPPPPPSTIAITVGNIFFLSDRNGTTNTAVDTVAVNGTATWTWVNTGATPHSVQSTGTPTFTSSALKTGNGQTYQFQFTQAGTYTYNCAEHGNGMTGRIVVR
jgi:plastocyanin